MEAHPAVSWVLCVHDSSDKKEPMFTAHASHGRRVGKESYILCGKMINRDKLSPFTTKFVVRLYYNAI